jgi:hypothetical protein
MREMLLNVNSLIILQQADFFNGLSSKATSQLKGLEENVLTIDIDQCGLVSLSY